MTLIGCIHFSPILSMYASTDLSIGRKYANAKQPAYVLFLACMAWYALGAPRKNAHTRESDTGWRQITASSGDLCCG
jgi:TRAP-type C4-dicarboxylate transport system permease large subunit